MQTLTLFGVPMTYLEIFGVVTALFCVALTVRQNIWCWPVGIISCVAFAVLFRDIKLYADMWLQWFFLATSFYGWHAWLHGGRDDSRLPVSHLTGAQRGQIGVLTLACIGVIGWAFSRYTDAHLPFWDALASGGSVTAQVLLMRKKIENWLLWIAVDALSVGIYIYKQVFLTAALYVLLLVLAAFGWREWKRDARESANA